MKKIMLIMPFLAFPLVLGMQSGPENKSKITLTVVNNTPDALRIYQKTEQENVRKVSFLDREKAVVLTSENESFMLDVYRSFEHERSLFISLSRNIDGVLIFSRGELNQLLESTHDLVS